MSLFPYDLPRYSDHLIGSLRDALAKTDEVAFHNVTHDNNGASILDASGAPLVGPFSRGGPFGALLAISTGKRLQFVGQARGNNVIGSGIASRHAEDQAMQPDNIELLTNRLAELSARGKNPFVWMITSGQSCTTCHTKQEILARSLIERKLLAPGRFITLYGATFDETFDIAQFYDVQYADAMIFFSRFPENRNNLIRTENVCFSEIPQEARFILRHAPRATAIVMREGEVYAKGEDTRTPFDPFSTPEVNAIRNACKKRREKEKVLESWKVDGELYTTTREVGPLLFAEAGWTKINTIKNVQMPSHMAHKQFETRETSDLSNAEFLHVIAEGYHTPEAALCVLRDRRFYNVGQAQWAEQLRVNSRQLYNGADVSPAVEAMRDPFTRRRFAAFDLETTVGSNRPRQLLRSRLPQNQIRNG